MLAMMVVNPGSSNEKVLKFYYDAEGRPIYFDLNETTYFYVTNLQGDVVALPIPMEKWFPISMTLGANRLHVYNFEVEGFHTYYVGDSGVLVHNQCAYQAPPGGGGPTDKISVNGKTIIFGHGGRRVEVVGLNSSQVNQLIANDVITKPPTNGTVKSEYLIINGISIKYNYYTLSNSTINIGTYVVEDKK